ncbi:MAG TPA: hypothetical protein VJL33_03415 [Candidatus Bathyarchaeia archaeon]|nr:hypothetical protein [Candidatus Bathyarchaeia archaeon]
MAKLSDFAHLSENTKNSLHIAWLSAVDFGQLKEKNNLSILNKTWKNLKNSLYPYFKDQEISLDDIAHDLKKITLTLNPSLSVCYNPKQGMLIYQLWGFLFDLITDNHECFAVSAFPAKLAGELVHEHEHYLFLKDHDLIGKERNCEDEMEQRALGVQLAFLENCKRNVPPSSLIEQFKVSEWSIDGKPTLHSSSSIDAISRTQLIAVIDDQIQTLIQANSEVDEGVYYSESCRIGISHCSDMAKVLSLPLKLNRQKGIYPEIIIDL